MTDGTELIVRLIGVLLILVLVVLTSSKRDWQGKKWLRIFLLGNFLLAVLSFVPMLLEFQRLIDRLTYMQFWDTMGLPSRIGGLIVWCALVPYVVTVLRKHTI